MRRADSFEKTLMWERLKVRREGDDRGWDGWMASPIQRAWVRVNSECWWWTGRPGVLQSMGSWRVGHDWATELTEQLSWKNQLCPQDILATPNSVGMGALIVAPYLNPSVLEAHILERWKPRIVRREERDAVKKDVKQCKTMYPCGGHCVTWALRREPMTWWDCAEAQSVCKEKVHLGWVYQEEIWEGIFPAVLLSPLDFYWPRYTLQRPDTTAFLSCIICPLGGCLGSQIPCRPRGISTTNVEVGWWATREREAGGWGSLERHIRFVTNAPHSVPQDLQPRFPDTRAPRTV